MNYHTSLLNCIKDSSKKGKIVIPSKIIALAKSMSNALSESIQEFESDKLYAELESEFGFIKQRRYQSSLLSDDESETVTGLIRWIKAIVKDGFKDSDDDFLVVSVLFLAAYIDSVSSLDGSERMLWREIVLPGNSSNVFTRKICLIISGISLSVQFDNPRRNEPNADNKSTFESADSLADFSKIDSLNINIDCLWPNILLRQSVLYLYYINFELLIKVSHKVSQSVLAFTLASILPRNACYLLGASSDSKWVQYWCLHAHSEFRNRRHRQEVSRRNHIYLTMLLRKISEDEQQWQHVMKVFNMYPIRYPKMQPSLAAALATAPDYALRLYAESIHMSGYGKNCDAVVTCIKKFCTLASDLQKIKLLKYCYIRWESKQNDLISRIDYRNEIIKLELLPAAAAYVAFYFTDNELDTIISRFENELSDLTYHWHESHSNFLTMYRLMLSRLQPYWMAWHFRSGNFDIFQKGDYYFSNGIENSPYSKIIFGQT